MLSAAVSHDMKQKQSFHRYNLKLVSLPLLCIPHSIQMSVNIFNLRNNFEKWKSNYSFVKNVYKEKTAANAKQSTIKVSSVLQFGSRILNLN